MLELVEEFPLTSAYGKIVYELKSSVTLLQSSIICCLHIIKHKLLKLKNLWKNSQVPNQVGLLFPKCDQNQNLLTESSDRLTIKSWKRLSCLVCPNVCGKNGYTKIRSKRLTFWNKRDLRGKLPSVLNQELLRFYLAWFSRYTNIWEAILQNAHVRVL